MRSDFSASAKRARLRIPVPALEIEAIRVRSAASGVRERIRRLIGGAAIALGAAGAAAALASTSGGWHIWLFGNNVEATVQSLGMMRYPMAADVHSLVARAAFPVVLPDGVRPGLRVVGIGYSPIERPTLMVIQYGNDSDPWTMAVSLIDTDKIAAGEKPLSALSPTFITRGYHFRVGPETVLVQGRHISAEDAQHVEAAMERESPAQTAAAVDVLLPRIVVLQKVNSKVAQAAERVARTGRNVVVGDWDIRIIPRLAAHGKPLRDSRTTYITNIPQVRGRPDYRNATFYWPEAIAIPIDGVRAVAAALRRSHTGPNCNCAILVHDSHAAYSVWKIDRKSLTVTRL